MGSSEGSFYSTPKDYYCQHYFEAIDLIITCINSRLNQKSYEIYHQLEELLIKASKQEDFKSELEFVCTFYKEDLKADLLQTQLAIFGVNYGYDGKAKITIFEIKEYFLALSTSQRSLLSEVCLLLQLILVLPATNATSERSFSAQGE